MNKKYFFDLNKIMRIAPFLMLFSCTEELNKNNMNSDKSNGEPKKMVPYKFLNNKEFYDEKSEAPSKESTENKSNDTGFDDAIEHIVTTFPNSPFQIDAIKYLFEGYFAYLIAHYAEDEPTTHKVKDFVPSTPNAFSYYLRAGEQCIDWEKGICISAWVEGTKGHFIYEYHIERLKQYITEPNPDLPDISSPLKDERCKVVAFLITSDDRDLYFTDLTPKKKMEHTINALLKRQPVPYIRIPQPIWERKKTSLEVFFKISPQKHVNKKPKDPKCLSKKRKQSDVEQSDVEQSDMETFKDEEPQRILEENEKRNEDANNLRLYFMMLEKKQEWENREREMERINNIKQKQAEENLKKHIAQLQIEHMKEKEERERKEQLREDEEIRKMNEEFSKAIKEREEKEKIWDEREKKRKEEEEEERKRIEEEKKKGKKEEEVPKPIDSDPGNKRKKYIQKTNTPEVEVIEKVKQNILSNAELLRIQEEQEAQKRKRRKRKEKEQEKEKSKQWIEEN